MGHKERGATDMGQRGEGPQTWGKGGKGPQTWGKGAKGPPLLVSHVDTLVRSDQHAQPLLAQDLFQPRTPCHHALLL